MSHLSQDQLIDVLYGLATRDHVDGCPECATRLRTMQERRTLTADAELQPAAFYHRQRRQILARAAEPQPAGFAPTRAVWVPAALAALMAVGIVMSRPVKPVASAPPVGKMQQVSLEGTDAAWFEDTYSEMQASEPRALSPMRNLFSEGLVE